MTDSMPQEHWKSIASYDKYRAGMVLHSVMARQDTKEFKAERAKEYILSLFPQFADSVESVQMFLNENTAYCKKIGCPAGVGGCYFVNENFILICWNPTVEYELVACHELLHYVSRLCGSSVSSVEQEENFAFSKSIRFALGIGKDLTWVRDVYMKPFYSCLARQAFSSAVVSNGAPQQVIGESHRKLAEQYATKKMNDLITKEIGPGAFSMSPKPSRPLPQKKDEDDEDAPLSYL